MARYSGPLPHRPGQIGGAGPSFLLGLIRRRRDAYMADYASLIGPTCFRWSAPPRGYFEDALPWPLSAGLGNEQWPS